MSSDSEIVLVFEEGEIAVSKKFYSRCSTINEMIEYCPVMGKIPLGDTVVKYDALNFFLERKPLCKFTNKMLVDSIAMCDFLGMKYECLIDSLLRRLTEGKFKDESVHFSFGYEAMNKIFSRFIKSSVFFLWFENLEKSQNFNLILPYIRVIIEEESHLKYFKGVKYIFVDENIGIEDKNREYISCSEHLFVRNEKITHIQNADNSLVKLTTFCPNLDNLDNLENLLTLNINLNEKINKFPPSLKNLTELRIVGKKEIHVDLSSLKNLRKLETREARTINTVPNPEKLITLNIKLSKIQKLSEIEIFSKMTNLNTLRANLNRNLNDIGEIFKLTNLDELSLLWTKDIANMEGLGVMTRLRNLSLSFKSDADLSFLGNLINLKFLTLNGVITWYRDPQAPRFSPRIRLYGNNDFNFLKRLHLRTLKIANANFNDVSLVKHMSDMRALDLGRTKINNLTGLKSLKKLVTFVGEKTDMGDLSNLSEISHVTKVFISHTNVTDVSALSNVRKLSIIGNVGIKDISSLIKLRYLRTSDDVHLDAPVSKYITTVTKRKCGKFYKTSTHECKNCYSRVVLPN
jgi:hypothetical protein